MFKARAVHAEDNGVLSDLKALSLSVSDDQLVTVERFATADEGEPVAWPLARLLVDRHRPDAAANVIVTALARREPGDRSYAMGKWWEYNFRERPNYRQVSQEIDEALLKQFASGSDERKAVVADLFGMDKADAKLPVEEFRKKLFPTTRHE